jgi:hypothetical protein
MTAHSESNNKKPAHPRVPGPECSTAPSILKARVILEACPPSLADRDKAYEMLRLGISCYPDFQALSVPDIQDEGEFSRKRERVPTAEFAVWLRELAAKPVNLYKVTVTCTRDELGQWLAEAESLGCRSIFLVGPDSSDKRYKQGALQVGDAARIVLQKGFECGGVLIPTRRRHFEARPASVDELDRVVKKVREFGLTFFSSQILYESKWMCGLLKDLLGRLQPDEIPRIFLTFCPFVSSKDLVFSRKTLGVYLPVDVERRLQVAGSMREASITCLLGVWERIFAYAKEIGFPQEKLGVNVEYLDSRDPQNVDAAFELAAKFSQRLKEN